jgi:hypothetical protein
MTSILKTCTPRPDLVSGSFNPEIFTASLRQVVGNYRGDIKVISIYSQAESFFKEATSTTLGMKQVANHVMRRLSGDNMVPFLTRLETGFGGGKTHTLIACAHLAYRGKELTDIVQQVGIVDPQHLPEPGTVSVVGIAGDELSVVRNEGDKVLPYTLWAELAKQVGGQELLDNVRAEAFTAGAPGEDYLNAVLGDRKALIMIDELAQYAARAEAAHSGMGEQIAAFFMALFNYARNHSGIAIVMTLASSTDAFAGQTKLLAKLLQKESGRQVSQDEAREIGELAIDSMQSVIARDAMTETPVTSEELSSVLAKRLFTTIDPSAARATAQLYRDFYNKHKGQLPARCTMASAEALDGGGDYAGLIAKYYPFHPTLVEFLNKKLATAEDFQGTRGVLRVLAFAVKSIWESGLDTEAIHTCHLDTTNPDLVNEILSKTEAGDLRNVLTADVGAVRGQGDSLISKSNAENADQENPHPAKIPMQVYAWRTVFLHSLVGRKQGISSSLFGLVREEARLEVSQPNLPPSQVDTALDEIDKRAFYLRHQDGKFFASLDPSVNKALAQIREGIDEKQIKTALEAAARKVVTASVPTFTVHYDVSAPEHLPDNHGKPMLGIVSLYGDSIVPEKFVLTERDNSPRSQQNLVFLLVPDTVKAIAASGTDPANLFSDEASQRNLRELSLIAKDVLAMRKLQKSPQEYSINPKHLNDDKEDGFLGRLAEREQALITRVTAAYKSLWYPSATGQVVHREIQAGSGEGGISVITQIRKTLVDDRELLTEDQISSSLLSELKGLFFSSQNICKIEAIRKNFLERRTWPVLADAALLSQIIRKGVEKGLWCVYKLGNPDDPRPSEFFSRESETPGVPIHVDLHKPDYSIVTPDGANQRGWTVNTNVPYEQVRNWVQLAVNSTEDAFSLKQLAEKVSSEHGEVSEQDISRAVQDMTRGGEAVVQAGPKDVKHGDNAMLYQPAPTDKILPVAKAVEKGWVKAPKKFVKIEGTQGKTVVFPLLKRLSSLYTRGASCKIDLLRIERLPLKAGGQVNVRFDGLEPAQIKQMAAIFDALVTLGQPDDETLVDLTILKPQDGCLLIKELERTK